MQLLKIINLFILATISIFMIGCEDMNTVRVTLQRSIAGNEVGTSNNPPSLSAIPNQSFKAGSAMATVNAGDNGSDHDVDGDTLTYSCFYDTSVDGSVLDVTTCGSLSGLSFNTSTGVMNWTTSLSDVGVYEFKISASDGSISDFKIFTLSVNANVAPVLDAIADQTTSEGIAITTIDAGEAGADVDSEGETLTYSCFFDTTIDGSVGTTNACSALSGATFNTTTGVLNWLPNLSQAGNYEFKISATDGADVSEVIFEITVNNTNQAPLLDTIANQTVSEGSAITTVDAGDSGDDYDRDGDLITYACYYDTTVDGAVTSTTSCLSLTGVTFDVGTGVMNWTPDYTQSGNYEFKIVGSDGSLTGEEIFTITVNNTNRAPVLDAISNQTVDELTAITTINAGDGGDDFDVDNDALTYSCFYDLTIDGAVSSTTACTSLTGVSFNSSTGVMDWKPSLTQSGTYEFKIIGSDGSLEGSRIFTITVNNITPFVFTWKTTTASEVMQLPVGSGGTYNYTVDWGDGTTPDTITTFADARKNHTYANAGTYTVVVKGVLSAIRFTGLDSRTKILEVVDLGNTQVTNLSSAFSGCSNLVSFAGGDTSKVTDMSNMFANTTSLVNIDLSTFNTSKVTTFSAMFQSASKIATLDLSNFDTSLNTSMYFMFSGMYALTSLDISSFNTSNVTTMYGAFSSLPLLTTLDVSHLNTSKVNNMGWMFYDLTKVTSLDLSSFDTRLVTNMGYMFRGTASLTSLNLSSFRTPLVTDMGTMFNGASKLTTLDVSMFNTSNVTRMTSMFSYMSELTSLDLSNFDTNKVTDMSNMFKGNSKMTGVNLSSFNTSKVTDMSSMFANTSKLVNLDLSNFDTTLVTNMSNMFYEASSLISLDISSFNTSNVTTMYCMFQSASLLTNLDLSNFNTSKVTTMASMFDSATSLTTLDLSSFDTSKVTSMDSMFYRNSSLISLNLTSFNTSSVTTMSSMFSYASSLTTLDLSSFNTENVTNMAYMFNSARKLAIDVSNFNTSKVTNMSSMFMSSEATSLDLSSFDTSKVTNMQTMFFATNNLTSLNATGWNVASVTSSSNIFSGVHSSFKVTCDQGGAPATGTLFGKTCY